MGGKSFFKRFLFRVEYMALLTLSAIFLALPTGALYGFAKGLGVFAFTCVQIRRKVTLENLRASFGAEKTDPELERISLAVLTEFGVLLAVDDIRAGGLEVI